jgi:transcriptional regulator
MYNPAHFTETRAEVLHALLRAHPLSTLVTLGADGMTANYIPMLLREGVGEHGALVGHVARANPVWRATDLEAPVLVLFQGAQHYITPSWYATKAEHGKVVPTWNYAVVQVRGMLQIRDDAEWLRTQVTQLTQQQESSFAKPWAVDDAPRDYTDTMIKALVGIEIAITSITGKWKVSQNQPPVNQATVVQGLQQLGTNAGQAMAALVQR